MPQTDRAILAVAAMLAAERGLDFAPEGFVDAAGRPVSPVQFAGLVAARLAATLPAPIDEGRVDVPERPGVRALRQIVELRRSMMTRLLAQAELAYEGALRSAGVKIVTRARNRIGKSRSAELSAAVSGREPLAPWLAVVGVTEMELLDRSFDSFRTQAEREFSRYRDRVLAITGRVGMTLNARRFQVEDAVKVMVAGLTAMARARLMHGDAAMLSAIPDVPRAVRRAPKGGGFDLPGLPNPDELSRAAAALVRNATAVAEGNGTFRLPTTADGMPDVIVSGPELMGDLAAELTVSPIWTWQHGFYGEPLSIFEPHDILDGFETTDRDADPGLVNDQSFPADEYFFPGDHDGCTCEWVPAEGDTGEEQPPVVPETPPPDFLDEALALTEPPPEEPVVEQAPEPAYPTVNHQSDVSPAPAREHENALVSYQWDPNALGVNAALRAGETTFADPMWTGADLVHELDAAMQPTLQDATMFRGAAMTADQIEALVQAGQFTDQAYTSVSINESTATMYARGRLASEPGAGLVKFVMSVPEGTSAAQGAFGSGEIVLARGQTYVITGVERTATETIIRVVLP
ncbi:MAG TPA: hypothetical protein VIA11_08505, partial [Acidimicrobiia bacterium]|nr:hypothetical protein [Acidimicrobiia bacterium]